MACASTVGTKTTPFSFMITTLDASNKEEVVIHYLNLPPTDRRLRFMHTTNEVALRTIIVENMFTNKGNFVFGAYTADTLEGKKKLIGVGQLAVTEDEKTQEAVAELAVSVDALYRRQGLGEALMKKGAALAKEKKFINAKVICASNNTPMANLARKLGAKMMPDETGDLVGNIPISKV